MSDDTTKLSIGQAVEANFLKEGKYFPGVIARIHHNGTYTIKYDDGDIERYVQRQYIRLQEKANTNNTSEKETKKNEKESEKEETKLKASEDERNLKAENDERIKTKRKENSEKDEEKEEEEKTITPSRRGRNRRNGGTFHEDDLVHYAIGDGKYEKATIEKVRKDGTYDISIHTDHGENRIATQIDGKDLEKYYSLFPPKTMVRYKKSQTEEYIEGRVQHASPPEEHQEEEKEDHRNENNTEYTMHIRSTLYEVSYIENLQYKTIRNVQRHELERMYTVFPYPFDNMTEVILSPFLLLVWILTFFYNILCCNFSNYCERVNYNIGEEVTFQLTRNELQWEYGEIIHRSSNGKYYDIRYHGEKTARRIHYSNIRWSLWGTIKHSFAGCSLSSLWLHIHSYVEYKDKKDVMRRGYISSIRGSLYNIRREKKKPKEKKEEEEEEEDAEEIIDHDIPASVIRVLDSPCASCNTCTLPSCGMESFYTLCFGYFSLQKGMEVNFFYHNVWIPGIITRVREKEKTFDIEYYDEKKKSKEIKKHVPRNEIRSNWLQWNDMTSLPFFTDEMDASLLIEGCIVEVEEKNTTKSVVHLGQIIESDRIKDAYTIEYEDGEKETNVSRRRIRLSTTKLRVGMKVIFYITVKGGKLVQKEGRIQWIYRNLNYVTIRCKNGKFKKHQNETDEKQKEDKETEEKYEIYPMIALENVYMENYGVRRSFQRLTAEVTSTNREYASFLMNFILEILVYLWFTYGICQELLFGYHILQTFASDKLIDPTYVAELYQKATINKQCMQRSTTSFISSMEYIAFPIDTFDISMTWLKGLLIVNTIVIILFIGIVSYSIYLRVMMLNDHFIDYKEKLLYVRYRHILSSFMLFLCLVTSGLLLTYSICLSLLEYYCFDISLASNLYANAFSVSPFSTSISANIIEALNGAIGHSMFNLFRTIYFVLLIEISSSLILRIISILPALVLSIFMLVPSISSYYMVFNTFRIVLQRTLSAGLSTKTNIAILLLFHAQYYNYKIIQLIFHGGAFDRLLLLYQMRGDFTDKILQAAEYGEYGSQAFHEVSLERRDRMYRSLGKWKYAITKLFGTNNWSYLFLFISVIVSFVVNGILLNYDQPKKSSLHLIGIVLYPILYILWSIFWFIIGIISKCSNSWVEVQQKGTKT